MAKNKMKKKALTDKQQLFAKEYLVDLNASAAYQRAGYKSKGNAAEACAYKLLRNAQVKEYIVSHLEKRFVKLDLSAEKVLNELAKLAFANMKDYAEFGPKGVKLIDSKTLTADQMAAVAEVSETITDSGGSTRFKLHDKTKNLEILAKYFKLFADVNINLSLAKAIHEALKDEPEPEGD